MLLAAREHRLNRDIQVPEVRVIGDDGEQMGVMPTADAFAQAQERGLDLVEVAPSARPPVVRFLDYGKFKYEQAKKRNEGRKRQKNVTLREVTMKPKIGQHDIDFKTRTAQKLLLDGDKLKITVMFRGREITHPEIGRELIGQVMHNLEGLGIPLSVEKPIGMEGRFMSVIVAEDKVKSAANAREIERAAGGNTPPTEEASAEMTAALDDGSDSGSDSAEAAEPVASGPQGN
jgi:translation initiation factor IF-3